MNGATRCLTIARVLIACGALLNAAGVTSARPGDLDPTFGKDGRVFFSVPDDLDIAATVVQQHDGKLVVGRRNEATDDDFSVLRFEPDGSPDASFDGDGRTSLDVSGIKGTTHVVLQQADGRIVAAGTASNSADSLSSNFGLARYNDDGSVDTTFGAGGVVIHDLGGSWDRISAIVQQADGRLVVAGQTDGGPSATSDMTFVRFTTNGSLDRSFGENGAVIINFHESNGYDSVQWLVQQADGTLIATGAATPSNPYNYEDMPIVRLLPDGQPDPSFDGDGRVTIELSDPTGQGVGNVASASSLASGADGGIVVVGNGNSNIWDYGTETPLIARVNSDGSPDTTFGDAGTAWIDLHGAHLHSVIAEANGAIYLAGAYRHDHFVARLTGDGVRDASFGVGGVAIIDTGDGDTTFHAGSATLIRQSDGKIVTVSSTSESVPWDDDPDTTRIVVARLLGGDGGDHPGLLGFYGRISGVEGDAVQVPVRRTGGSSGSVTVDYATASGSATSGVDFTAASGTLSWGDGDMADKTIVIHIADDSTDEDAEYFGVALSSPLGGAILASSVVVVQIEGSTSQSPSPAASGGGGGGGVDWLGLACLIALLPLLRRRASGRLDGSARGCRRGSPATPGRAAPGDGLGAAAPARHLIATLAIALVGPLCLMGCGGSGGDGGAPGRAVGGSSQSSPVTGMFIDSPVAGLSYACGTRSGETWTDAPFRGVFHCDDFDERITFTIGDIEIGNGDAERFMSPVDLVKDEDPTADIDHDWVTNIARFLLTIDDEGNAGNGIQITQAVRDAAAGLSVEFEQSGLEFENDTAVASAVASLTVLTSAGARGLISAAVAREHLMLSQPFLTYTGSFDGSGYQSTPVPPGETPYPAVGDWAFDVDSTGALRGTVTFRVARHFGFTAPRTFLLTGTLSDDGDIRLYSSIGAEAVMYLRAQLTDGAVEGTWDVRRYELYLGNGTMAGSFYNPWAY